MLREGKVTISTQMTPLRWDWGLPIPFLQTPTAKPSLLAPLPTASWLEVRAAQEAAQGHSSCLT